jgi:hypothetical protein
MTVRELKEVIASLPDEMEVVLQRDSEGNGYSPLSGVDPDAVYISETRWYGDVYSMDWTAEEACMTEEEWEEIKGKPRTLILYPVN